MGLVSYLTHPVVRLVKTDLIKGVMWELTKSVLRAITLRKRQVPCAASYLSIRTLDSGVPQLGCANGRAIALNYLHDVTVERFDAMPLRSAE